MRTVTLSLRHRILITLIPLLLLLAAIGSGGIVLLFRLGNSVDAILRENYRSVIAMEGLNEAVERIDSSFQFALSGRRDKAWQQYTHSWESYLENLEIEKNNITVPGEAELVAQLEQSTNDYRKQGNEFYATPADTTPSSNAVAADAGLLPAGRPARRIRPDQRGLGTNPAPQSVEHGAGQCRRAASGEAIRHRLRRRTRHRARPGWLCRVAHHADDPAARAGGDAGGAGHQRRQPQPAGPLSGRRRVGAVGPRLQHDDPPFAGVSPVAVGPVAAGAAREPGHGRFISRPGDRHRLGRLRRNRQSGRPSLARRVDQAPRTTDFEHLATAGTTAAAAGRRAQGAAGLLARGIRPCDSARLRRARAGRVAARAGHSGSARQHAGSRRAVAGRYPAPACWTR